MPQQFNYVDLAAPAHEFLHQEARGDVAPRDSAAGDVAPGDTACHDFPSWYIAHNGWLGYFGRGREGIVKQAVSYRRKHPDRPLSLWFLPPGTNESFAYMHLFDPAFADAFYTLDWQSGFDQAATLARVVAPSVLVHANWRITDAGVLEGAMTDDDAARACDLMADCVIERVDTGHGFHVERPADFAALFHQVLTRTAS